MRKLSTLLFCIFSLFLYSQDTTCISNSKLKEIAQNIIKLQNEYSFTDSIQNEIIGQQDNLILKLQIKIRQDSLINNENILLAEQYRSKAILNLEILNKYLRGEEEQKSKWYKTDQAYYVYGFVSGFAATYFGAKALSKLIK